MTRKKMSDEQVRQLVQQRLTKGDAFRLSDDEYYTRQATVALELASMLRSEIFEKYPNQTYDIVP